MQTLGNAREHFFRVIKMAKANNVDLSSAFDEGKITLDAYADMITGCQGCTQVGKCDKLLDKVSTLTEAPEYCVNRDTFQTLQSS
jgi:hypothetical protein